jgi:hypothetical protein
MQMKFIGGPRDGEEMEFPDFAEIRFMKPLDMAAIWDESKVPSSQGIKTYFYKRVQPGVYRYAGVF